MALEPPVALEVMAGIRVKESLMNKGKSNRFCKVEKFFSRADYILFVTYIGAPSKVLVLAKKIEKPFCQRHPCDQQTKLL
jgi:hypothetical protein